MISQFDNNLTDLTHSDCLNKKISEKQQPDQHEPASPDPEQFRKKATVSVDPFEPQFDQFAFVKPERRLKSNLVSSSNLVKIDFTESGANASQLEGESGFLKKKTENSKLKLKRSQRTTCLKSRRESNDLKLLELDESVMDIVIRNFDQSNGKKSQRADMSRNDSYSSDQLLKGSFLGAENK